VRPKLYCLPRVDPKRRAASPPAPTFNLNRKSNPERKAPCPSSPRLGLADNTNFCRNFHFRRCGIIRPHRGSFASALSELNTLNGDVAPSHRVNGNRDSSVGAPNRAASDRCRLHFDEIARQQNASEPLGCEHLRRWVCAEPGHVQASILLAAEDPSTYAGVQVAVPDRYGSRYKNRICPGRSPVARSSR
jgi:hypothetical protein